MRTITMVKRTKMQLAVYTKYRFLRKVLPNTSFCFNDFVLCRINRLRWTSRNYFSVSMIPSAAVGAQMEPVDLGTIIMCNRCQKIYFTSIIGYYLNQTMLYYLSVTVIMLNFCSRANILPSTDMDYHYNLR